MAVKKDARRQPRGDGAWSRARAYLTDHPNATTKEVMDAAGCPANAVYQTRTSMGIKGIRGGGGVTAGDALKQFKSVRAGLKDKAKLPGNDNAVRPTTLSVGIGAGGVELELRDSRGKMIGTMELDENGLLFRMGRAERSDEKRLAWAGLSAMQGSLFTAIQSQLYV